MECSEFLHLWFKTYLNNWKTINYSEEVSEVRSHPNHVGEPSLRKTMDPSNGHGSSMFYVKRPSTLASDDLDSKAHRSVRPASWERVNALSITVD